MHTADKNQNFSNEILSIGVRREYFNFPAFWVHEGTHLSATFRAAREGVQEWGVCATRELYSRKMFYSTGSSSLMSKMEEDYKRQNGR